MLIGFDAASAATNVTATSITRAHTVGAGSERLLVLGFSCNNSSDIITAVTFNGVAMNRIIGANLLSGFHALYYQLSPPSGTFDAVVQVSPSAALRMDVASYTGVEQSGQPDSSNSGSVSGTTLAVATNVVAANSWLVGYGNSISTISAGTATTERTSGTAHAMYDSNGPVAAGSRSLEVTQSVSGSLRLIVASFKPSSLVEEAAATVIPSPGPAFSGGGFAF